MERLTARNESGEAYYKRCYESPCDGTGEACDDCNFIDIKVCEALAAFEDNGITPEQMREISDEYRKVCEELNKVKVELVELKKQLPLCKVGDTVYVIVCDYDTGKMMINDYVIHEISMYSTGIWYKRERFPGFKQSDFGKTIFLTESEAQAAVDKANQDTEKYIKEILHGGQG